MTVVDTQALHHGKASLSLLMNEQGGIDAMAAKAAERSKMLYDYMDSTDGYYANRVEGKYRSRMNIPFRVCDNEELEAKFIKEAATVNLIETKGHRSVGGCRVSLYNAMPIEGVEALIAFMKQFREANPKA